MRKRVRERESKEIECSIEMHSPLNLVFGPKTETNRHTNLVKKSCETDNLPVIRCPVTRQTDIIVLHLHIFECIGFLMCLQAVLHCRCSLPFSWFCVCVILFLFFRLFFVCFRFCCFCYCHSCCFDSSCNPIFFPSE